jgi:hypothetical protein
MKRDIFIFLLMVSTILLFNSCTKEGDIFDDVDSRDAFTGEWIASDQCSKQTYRVNVTLDAANSTQVIISNFANLGYSATAVVAGNSIYVSNQSVGGGYSVNGSGIISGSVISWTTYNFESDGESTSCICTFTAP